MSSIIREPLRQKQASKYGIRCVVVLIRIIPTPPLGRIGPYWGMMLLLPFFFTVVLVHAMQVSLYLCVVLGHGVKSATVLEPLDLAGVEGVGQLDLEGLALLGLDDHGEGLANLELGALQVNLCRIVSR